MQRHIENHVRAICPREIARVVAGYAYSSEDAIRAWITRLPRGHLGGKQQRHEFHFKLHRLKASDHICFSTVTDSFIFDFIESKICADEYQIRIAILNHGGRPRMYIYHFACYIPEIIKFCESKLHTNEDSRLCRCRCHNSWNAVFRGRTDWQQWNGSHDLYYALRGAL